MKEVVGIKIGENILWEYEIKNFLKTWTLQKIYKINVINSKESFRKVQSLKILYEEEF